MVDFLPLLYMIISDSPPFGITDSPSCFFICSHLVFVALGVLDTWHLSSLSLPLKKGKLKTKTRLVKTIVNDSEWKFGLSKIYE